MSIASELATLSANKAAIKSAIEAKSPATAPTDALAQWPTAIASIPSGQEEEWDGDYLKIKFNNRLEDWPTSSTSFTMVSGGTSINIDWGDGETSTIGGYSSATHEYASRGIYYIVVTFRTSGRDFNDGGFLNKLGVDEVWLPKGFYFGLNSAVILLPASCLIHLPKSGVTGDRIGIPLGGYSEPMVLRTSSSSFYRWTDPYFSAVKKIVITNPAYSINTVQYAGTLYNLAIIEFDNGNTSITCGSYAFQGLPHLTKIIGLNTIVLTQALNIFYCCQSLYSIPALDMTSSDITDARYMFAECYALRVIPTGVNVSNCTTTQEMFSQCRAITSVPNLDTSKSTNCYAMFYNCASLTSVPDLDLSASTRCDYMFRYCSKILNAPRILNLSVCTNVTEMFGGCTAMTTLPESITANPNNALTLTFPSKVIDIDTLATFDANEDIVGGLVYGLVDNTGASSAWTLAFAAEVKTAVNNAHANGWDKVKAMANAKNWNISPA